MRDLQRFEKAHSESFDRALSEIRNGRKTSHWMWYIFPQIIGLGFSDTSKYYAIENLEEARDFLENSLPGKNILRISSELLNLDSNNATTIFGKPDDAKLQSSMTLFAAIPNASPIFQKVLDKYFGGKQDIKTVALLTK